MDENYIYVRCNFRKLFPEVPNVSVGNWLMHSRFYAVYVRH